MVTCLRDSRAIATRIARAAQSLMRYWSSM